MQPGQEDAFITREVQTTPIHPSTHPQSQRAVNQSDEPSASTIHTIAYDSSSAHICIALKPQTRPRPALLSAPPDRCQRPLGSPAALPDGGSTCSSRRRPGAALRTHPHRRAHRHARSAAAAAALRFRFRPPAGSAGRACVGCCAGLRARP